MNIGSMIKVIERSIDNPVFAVRIFRREDGKLHPIYRRWDHSFRTYKIGQTFTDRAITGSGGVYARGFYALKYLNANNTSPRWGNARNVPAAVVALWGRVVTHESGYRAQYMRIITTFESIYSANLALKALQRS